MAELSAIRETPHSISESPSILQSQLDSTAFPHESSTDNDSRRRTRAIQPDNAGDDFEAIELHHLSDCPSHLSSLSTVSYSSEDYNMGPRRWPSHSSTVRSATDHENSTFPALSRFWSHHVSLVVPHKHNRDYFALERTFLAYIRTSLAFSMQGVMIAQLFQLQSSSPHDPLPAQRLDFSSVGIPLSTAYHGCAIIVAALGAYRFWRQQNAIVRDKVYTGGWEMNVIGLMSIAGTVSLFALAVAIIALLD